MKICDKLRNHIMANGLKFNFVADKSGINRKKFYRLINGVSSMTVDEFEQICRIGLSVDPRYFFAQEFSEIENQKPA